MNQCKVNIANLKNGSKFIPVRISHFVSWFIAVTLLFIIKTIFEETFYLLVHCELSLWTIIARSSIIVDEFEPSIRYVITKCRLMQWFTAANQIFEGATLHCLLLTIYGWSLICPWSAADTLLLHGASGNLVMTKINR